MALKQTLARLVVQAQGGQVGRVRLGKGLHIALRMRNGLLDVQLSRENVSPSVQEWLTVLNCLPQHVLVIKPQIQKVEQKYYLRGSVRLAAELLGAGNV